MHILLAVTCLITLIGKLFFVRFQVKPPKVLKFQTLREALSNPGEFLLSDFAKFDRPPLLHLAFQALDAFRAESGSFPAPASVSDANRLVELAHSINESKPGDQKLDTIDDNIIRLLGSGSRAVLGPMAAMFGGIVGQEVVKACSGKFHPLFQVGVLAFVPCQPTYILF